MIVATTKKPNLKMWEEQYLDPTSNYITYLTSLGPGSEDVIRLVLFEFITINLKGPSKNIKP